MKILSLHLILGVTLSIYAACCCYALIEIIVQNDDLGNLPFEHAYPRHLRAKKVSGNGTITIDGKLDEEVWNLAMWESHFVDITRHENETLNKIPSQFQSSVAVLWDETYLYIGARIKEPFVFGKLTGHNIQAPYHDNDFEVFIDVSGTTEYYKEFEMNVLNATYDVNWGVPDNADLACDDTNNREKPYLPVCVNTSFPGYAGNWTMKNRNSKGPRGLRTATFFKQNMFGKYITNNEWTLEIAFPISRSQYHGGLLDTYGEDKTYEKYHPRYASNKSKIPLYWWIDFARAEHPRRYVSPDYLSVEDFCPLACNSNLSTYSVSKENPNASQCLLLQDRFPTLLGSDPTYGCYFEWVYQDVGKKNNYMHRPQEWAILEFSDSNKNCRNIEFVGRHAVKLIYFAQILYKRYTNSYANNLHALMNPKYCGNAQDCKDLRVLVVRADVFKKVSIKVVNNATVLTKECTSRPCFLVKLRVSAPMSRDSSQRHVYVVTVNENLLINVKHEYTTPEDVGHKICF